MLDAMNTTYMIIRICGLGNGDCVSHPADIVNRMLGARKNSGNLAPGCAMRVYLAGNHNQSAGARSRREDRAASRVAREPALVYGRIRLQLLQCLLGG